MNIHEKQRNILAHIAIKGRGEIVTNDQRQMVVTPTCDHNSVINVFFKAIDMNIDTSHNPRTGTVVVYWPLEQREM